MKKITPPRYGKFAGKSKRTRKIGVKVEELHAESWKEAAEILGYSLTELIIERMNSHPLVKKIQEDYP